MLDTDHARHQKARRQGLPPATPYARACHLSGDHDPFAYERGGSVDPVAGQRRPRAPSHSQRVRTSFPTSAHEAHYYPSHSVNVDPLPRSKKNRVHIVD